MGCTCKKTRCLKLYCQCFGAKLLCGMNCRCLNCANVPVHEKERTEAMRSILLRNPTAFETKFKRASTTGTSMSLPPSLPIPQMKSAPTEAINPNLAHKLGCKCRKSACMKKVRKDTELSQNH